MRKYKILMLILIILFMNSCYNTKNIANTESIQLKFKYADSLWVNNSIDVAHYTYNNLLTDFNSFDKYRKTTVIKYLNKDNTYDDLIKLLLKENISICDLEDNDLIKAHLILNNKKYNPNIIFEELIKSDQEYRSQLDSVDLENENTILNKMIEQDSINEHLLKNYIYSKKIQNLINSDNTCSVLRAIYMIGIHSDNIEFKKNIMHILKKNKKRGSTKLLAYFIDRFLITNNKKQIYGTQLKYNIDTNKMTPYPIKDTTDLSRLRYNMNLINLEVYINYMNNKNEVF